MVDSKQSLSLTLMKPTFQFVTCQPPKSVSACGEQECRVQFFEIGSQRVKNSLANFLTFPFKTINNEKDFLSLYFYGPPVNLPDVVCSTTESHSTFEHFPQVYGLHHLHRITLINCIIAFVRITKEKSLTLIYMLIVMRFCFLW